MKKLPFTERVAHAKNLCGRRLLQLIADKQTNLAFSADVTNKSQLLDLVDMVGPYVCIIKTHIDIVEDFDWQFVKDLNALAKQHQFLLFEDRKFADIGNTVSLQYSSGTYRIADWADMVNAHLLPGPGIVAGLKQVGLPKERGLLLLANMSSASGLFTPQYVEETVRVARENYDFILGYISQNMVDSNPGILHITPGINLGDKNDSLGQRYRTPYEAICRDGCDVGIVGRGIISSANPLEITKKYQHNTWQAYRDCV